ncbi:MAG: glycosyltransferase family 4 protein [Candidatus Omnitrophota bacterium]
MPDNKKIKILRVIARLNIGGPAIHTILLTQGLDKSRFQTLLACGRVDEGEGDMFYYAAKKEIQPLFIPELRRSLNLFNDLIALKKIYNIIAREHPDIVHTHTAKAGALGRLAAVLYNLFHPHSPRIRIFHTFHGHVFEGYFSPFKARVFLCIERFLARFSDKIITVSSSLKRELVSLGIAKEEKIAVIPLGLELEEFLQIPPRRSDILNVGIISRLVPVKNHKFFLEAAARLVADNPQLKIKFKIIGDGRLRQELEQYCRSLKLEAQVEFLGWQRDLASVYSDLDIVALTSLNEGTPVSLIEAMACGRAVAATDVGGVADLLGRNGERGVIAVRGDLVGFAGALSGLLKNDKLRQELGIRAREFVKNNFSKARLIRDMEGLYTFFFI